MNNVIQHLLKRTRLIILSISMLACFGYAANAYSQAQFLIWPIYPKIENDQKAVPVWLENVGDSPALVQVRVFKWTQHNYSEQFATQDEIMASPPIVKIPAGSKQMLRFTRTQNTADLTENAYRIIIDELPVETTQEAEQNNVSFKMRYSIPLFSYGTGIGSGLNKASLDINKKNPQAKAILKWRIVQVAGKDVLEIENQGAMAVRIAEFHVADQTFKADAENNAFGYVLPQSVIHFVLTVPLKSALLKNPSLSTVVGAKNTQLSIEQH